MAASLAKSVVSGEFAEVLTAVQLAQKLLAGKGKGGSKEANARTAVDLPVPRSPKISTPPTPASTAAIRTANFISS